MDSPRRIMLVEDNPDDALLTRRALSTSGVSNDVAVARDGADALALLLNSETGALPELVLLDINLPKVNGLEVLARLREHDATQHLPVVILTTSDEATDVHSAYELRANSYIRKPVDFEQFADAVRSLGRYWLTLNQAPGEDHG